MIFVTFVSDGTYAYIPVNAHLTGSMAGAMLTIEPIDKVLFSVDDLASALTRAKDRGNPTVPIPEKYDPKTDVLLKATGAKSWKAIARNGPAYSLEWSDSGEVTLYLSELDKQGRYASGIGETKHYPADTPMHDIAQAIVEDARSKYGEANNP